MSTQRKRIRYPGYDIFWLKRLLPFVPAWRMRFALISIFLLAAAGNCLQQSGFRGIAKALILFPQSRSELTSSELTQGQDVSIRIELPEGHSGPLSSVEIDLYPTVTASPGQYRIRIGRPFDTSEKAVNAADKSLASSGRSFDIKAKVPKNIPPGTYFIGHIATYPVGTSPRLQGDLEDYWRNTYAMTADASLLSPDLVTIVVQR